MPNSEMMKLTARSGCMLSCGWLPRPAPVAALSVTALARRRDNCSVGRGALPLAAAFAGDGSVRPAGGTLWVCAGICFSGQRHLLDTAGLADPVVDARPWPMCTGTRPCRSGTP